MATAPNLSDFTRWQGDLSALIEAPRSFTVASDTSYIGGKHIVWHLRCYGRGVSSVGDGNRNTFPSEAVAEAHGQAWVKTGVAPCFQGMCYGAVAS